MVRDGMEVMGHYCNAQTQALLWKCSTVVWTSTAYEDARHLTVLCCSQYDSQYDILHTILFRWYIVINDFEHVFHNQAT